MLIPLTEKNAFVLETILKHTLPVTYPADFFASLNPSLCRLGLVSDVPVSAIACKLLNEDSDSLYVAALSTLAPYRSLGQASCLLDWAEKEGKLRKCKSITLHTQETNTGLLEFYKKRGYEVKERVQRYYPTLSDQEAVYLVKSL